MVKIVLLSSQLVANIIERSTEIERINKSLVELRSENRIGEIKFLEQKLARREHARDRFVEVAMRYAQLHPEDCTEFDLDKWEIVRVDSDPRKREIVRADSDPRERERAATIIQAGTRGMCC